MSAGKDKKIIKKYRSGTVQWNSGDEIEKLFDGKRSKFLFSVFECDLFTVRKSSYNGEWNYTEFRLENTFPSWFSSLYTFSLIGSKEKQFYTVKGVIQKNSEQILMTFTKEELQSIGNIKSIHISWFEEEGCAMSEKCVQVNPDIILVLEKFVQTEPLQHLHTRDKCISTEIEPVTLLETLSEDLRRFYERKTGTDCMLKVGSSEFPVHRQVLSARSDVFEAMFHHDTSESRSGRVDISDIEADVLSDILFYVYTGKIRNMTADSAVQMCIAADKYALMELREKCMDFLLHNLTLENFCDAAVLAHTHGEAELENEVVHFIGERSKELVNNENWKHFMSNKSVLASKLLYSALLANNDKTVS